MSPDAAVAHRDRLPPRNLTLLYLGFAYSCLAAALLTVMLMPQTVGGFFYHPKMLAVVHLVTLGWISSSILGSFYLIAPIAMRTVMRPRRADYVAWLLVVVGVVGMVSHFWIEQYSGMVWSAATLWIGLAYVGVRGIRTIAAARIQRGVKIHVGLAFLNILGAGVLGMLIGVEKQLIHVLPGSMLYSVYAHAHLAAVGWATMMVMGTAYRLFPMVLPAAMPSERQTWASALLTEAGLLVLLVALPARSVVATRLACLLIVGGLATFFWQVAWMRRHPKKPPKGLRRPDFATLHVLQAIGYLAIAAVLGVVLAFGPNAAWKIRVATFYGVFGLVGFLAQIIIGIAARILPMFAWMHFYVDGNFAAAPPSQYTMHSRILQAAGFAAWTLGVPLLAWGLSYDRWAMMSLAAGLLLAALAANAINGILIVRYAFVRQEPTGEAS